MLSRFFIHRPVFALVISIVISLMGALAIPTLPIEQTPDITPPTVAVTARYPGASATVIADAVAVPLEQQINGVDDMIYLSSQSSDDGSMQVTVTFGIGVDVDMASVLVQNRVAAANAGLPEEVTRQGVTTKKQSTNMVQLVNLLAPDGGYDDIYISNYINLNIKDVLGRVPGVADVQVLGARDYGMRIWLDPERLKARGLTTNDVVGAIREQNVQVAAGQIGAPPSPTGQAFQYTVNTAGRLSDVSEFENLILRVTNGAILRLRDVARVELGAQTYGMFMRLNGQPTVGLAIYQLPGSNALEVASGVRAAMDELSVRFPAGLTHRIAYDSTRAITASINEVAVTLLIAMLLVIGTVYLFLQDLRTTLIPAVTIPVSLLGTFAVMVPLGLSINTLTLFGLVLAIGIVVDDAIVVVENTMRLIDDEGLSAKAATAKAMEQVTGPVIATTVVLLAVFVPVTMMGGITGRLYSQFAITIATATVISSINALTLSPALCGMLLRPTPAKRGWLFRQFNRALDAVTGAYTGLVRVMVRRAALVMLLFVALLGAGWVGFGRVPGGFVPNEDSGAFFANVQLPDSASLERTEEVMEGVTRTLMATPGVVDVVTIGGFSMLTGLNASNTAAAIVVLEDWSARETPDLDATAIAGMLTGQLLQIQEATAFAFTPPPINGLGSAGGFELRLQDRGGAGLQQLQTIADDLAAAGNQHPVLTRVNNSFRANVPQLYLDVDRTKAQTLGIQLNDVFSTLAAYLGSAYVNDFSVFGRTYRVMIQADAAYRSGVDDISRLEVRDQDGNMIPLSTLLTVRDSVGPQAVTRYNLFPSASITGSPRPGFSSGQAREAMEELAARLLPPTMGYEWTGTTYQEIVAGNQAPILFGLAFVFVFLFMAAQYESWLIPLAVIFAIPLALIGAIYGTLLRSYDNNVYTQIGLILLIGISAKTAILIVEFAKQLREEGRPTLEAAVEAARLRFRAVLMTAVSFILGVVPLLVASGAGAGSRRALGTAVFAGMVVATILGVCFIPVFFVAVQRLRDRGKADASSGTATAGSARPAPGGQPGGSPPRVQGHGIGVAVVLISLSAGAACRTVGPDYVPPVSPMPDRAPVPDAWHSAAVDGLGEGQARLQRWWDGFNDPTLVSLIERAHAMNLDVKLAVTRIQESRSNLDIASRNRFPDIQATGDVSISQPSAATVPTEAETPTDALGSIGIAATWEPDVFGRISRGIEAALADYHASVEDLRDVLVLLSAEVALSYIDLRTLQDRVRVTRNNLQLQQESLQLTRDRFAAGLTSALDVAQAESNVYDTESQIPPLERGLALALNRLAILLASPPGALEAELNQTSSIPVPSALVTVGIPVDLVRQRPDIRAAERLLAAQTARVGVATADLYPSFSMGGLFSFDIGSIGDATGFGWNILPGVRWALFDRDRIRSRIDVEESRTARALLTYEQRMLNALEDVENAMVSYGRDQEQRARLRDAVDASLRAVDLVRTRYLTGLTDFLNVLDSQRTLFVLEDRLAALDGVVVQDLILLYRALGGGWEVASLPVAGPVEGGTP